MSKCLSVYVHVYVCLSEFVCAYAGSVSVEKKCKSLRAHTHPNIYIWSL
jgi:hypothetical protein